MKRVTVIFLIAILVSSCNSNNKQLEELKEENKRLRNQLEKLQSQSESPKFIWTVISCKTGSYVVASTDGKTGFEGELKNTIYWSEILEASKVDEALKYRQQDLLENQIRSQLGQALHSIQKRETYVFDTYVEASKFKNEFLNNN